MGGKESNEKIFRVCVCVKNFHFIEFMLEWIGMSLMIFDLLP